VELMGISSTRASSLSKALGLAAGSPHGCDATKGILEDRGYLVPINGVLTWRIEEHPKPTEERPLRRHLGSEESLRFGTHQFLLHARRRRTPNRDPAITTRWWSWK
jgi:hypothetical protein